MFDELPLRDRGDGCSPPSQQAIREISGLEAGAKMLKQEKRMVPRAKVRWPVTMLTSQAQVEGKIENVSSKGAFVSCKDMPPLEEGFLLVIRAPDYKSMNLNGRVVWSTVLSSNEDGSQFGIGVQFTRMTAEDRKALHKMIALHYGLKTKEKAERS